MNAQPVLWGVLMNVIPRLPNDEAHKTISRHHCLIDINPPDIRVRDFGSLNGTFVNDEKIGQRKRGQSLKEAKETVFPEYDLKEGDVITLGDTGFRVGIYIPAICMDCSAEIPDEPARTGMHERTHIPL